jgi:glyoxylase-like metal-dependent hydrolase (beta-lactamase superfamily II)
VPRLLSITGNSQKLDGGAMYGNAPRAMWAKWTPPDDLNRIDLACRALLVIEDSGRNVLFETGIGAFFEPKLRDRYGVQESHHVLLESLATEGLKPDDIDVVVLSHLHFDHAGGLLAAHRDGTAPSLAFSNASFVIGKRAWERAIAPHARDRASFIPELQPLLEATGRVELVDGPASNTLGAGYRFHYSDGHTPGLLISEIATDAGPVVFVSDLIPAAPWVHVPLSMGYDRFPELLIEEKKALLDDLITRKGRLFFTHDASRPMAGIAVDAKGKYSAV